MDVKIYIETSLQGPAVKDGKYAVLLEYMTGKGPVTLLLTGKEKETTFHRSTLQAAVHALRRLKYACKVDIYSYCSFVNNMITAGNPWKWKENGWKKSDGETVQNKDLWKSFTELANQHDITMHFSKHHDYRDKLKRAMEEK